VLSRVVATSESSVLERGKVHFSSRVYTNTHFIVERREYFCKKGLECGGKNGSSKEGRADDREKEKSPTFGALFHLAPQTALPGKKFIREVSL